MKQRFPPARCIAIDVDGTLIRRGVLNRPLVEWAKERKADGFDVLLWTARGRAHAERVAKAHGIEDAFTAILGKPGYLVDDLGWRWTRYTRVLRRLSQLGDEREGVNDSDDCV